MPQRQRIVKLLCILAVTGLVLWVGLHGAIRARELQRRLACASNLKGIAASSKTCDGPVGDGTGSFFEWLVATGQVDRRSLICPSSGLPTSNYIVVPVVPRPQDGPIDHRAVIAYEPKSNHGGEGGNVVFADGRASFIRVPEFDELVRSIRAWSPGAPGRRDPSPFRPQGESACGGLPGTSVPGLGFGPF
jgi:prepilin-type processing-associated H-X9-DG protein